MPLRALAAAAVLAAALPAAPARAATVETDRSCYLERAGSRPVVAMRATGYTAGARYQVVLGNQPLQGGTGNFDGAGAMSGRFTPPALGGRTFERHVLSVQEGSNSASATFGVTRFGADFSPTSGDPARMRVRFRAFGFGIDEAAPSPEVFVHYVRPDGSRHTTVRLGRATGPCGSIARTAKRRLFPFKVRARGTWRLQFDTSRSYRRGTDASDFLFFTLPVRIRR